jgi:hydroxyethylthiazole kinase-like uncharacterized protein yjeF
MTSNAFLKPGQQDLALLSVEQVRQAEQTAYAGMDSFTLMARAGYAAFLWACERLEGKSGVWTVLAGPGNNGGDAYVLATHALEAGTPVKLYALGQISKKADDALLAKAGFLAAGGEIHPTEDFASLLGAAGIVDGLFGIGLTNPPTGEAQRLIRLMNSENTMKVPVLSLDIPSGLNANTGQAFCDCVKATHTLSFIAAKPGLFTLDGPDQCGEITVADLGLQDAAAPHPQSLYAEETLLSQLKPRNMNSHKGSHGDVVVVGGDQGMVGAAILAARTALHLGAGRVFLGLLDGPQPPGYDPLQPELMMRSTESLLKHAGVWVVGPGLGQSTTARALLSQLLDITATRSAPDALLLDADALNLLAQDSELAEKFAELKMPTVITPHPLEAARLLGLTTEQIQADRMGAAQQLSQRFNTCAVLKGAGSVIAHQDQLSINLSGGPALATGGTGDVLAGALGALLAQFGCESLHQTVALGVFLHGQTVEPLGLEKRNPRLLTASEVMLRIKQRLNHT